VSCILDRPGTMLEEKLLLTSLAHNPKRIEALQPSAADRNNCDKRRRALLQPRLAFAREMQPVGDWE
jgi:hypothetical protein